MSENNIPLQNIGSRALLCVEPKFDPIEIHILGWGWGIEITWSACW